MLQSLQVNIVISYKTYVTNYNIYRLLEWSEKKRQVAHITSLVEKEGALTLYQLQKGHWLHDHSLLCVDLIKGEWNTRFYLMIHEENIKIHILQ